MRIVQFRSGREIGCGVEHDGQVFATGYADTLSLIRDAQLGLERAAAAPGQGDPVAVDRILAPLTNPGKMFGSGVNYRSHGDEEPGFTFPDEVPWDFIKVASAIIGPGDDIVIPPADDVIKRAAGGGKQFDEFGFAVDYEVEFGVVIGKRAKNVAAENALDHIFGYTVFNDVGSRSVQFHNGQRDLGKNFDTFCPMGPCIVTADELPDWQDVRDPVVRQRRAAPVRAGGRADRTATGGNRVAQLDHHARAWRLPDDGHPGGVRHVHGSAGLPQPRRHGHLLRRGRR